MINWDYKKLLMALATGALLTACQPDTKVEDEGTSTVTEQKDATEQVVTSDIKEEDKVSYALGAKMAKFIRDDLEKYNLPNVNKKAITDGFNDAMLRNSQMSEQEINQQFVKFQQAIQAAHQQAQAVAKAKAEEDAKIIIASGDAFLVENAKKDGVKTTETGIQYRVMKEGESGAATPKATDRVKVHYHGTFIDGKVFDSSVDRNEPSEFGLNGVIKGWTEGLQLMSIGSKYHFVIPWALAYGPNGRPGIPGHSVLQFEIELLEINPKKEAVKEAAAKK